MASGGACDERGAHAAIVAYSKTMFRRWWISEGRKMGQSRTILGKMVHTPMESTHEALRDLRGQL